MSAGIYEVHLKHAKCGEVVKKSPPLASDFIQDNWLTLCSGISNRINRCKKCDLIMDEMDSEIEVFNKVTDTYEDKQQFLNDKPLKLK